MQRERECEMDEIRIQHQMRENRRLFEAGIRHLAEIQDGEDGLDFAWQMMHFAQDSGCGYFASSAIERRLCDFAEQLEPPKKSECRPDSVLMVMTEACRIGGHTRVVERWIEQDPSRCYSLVLTDQSDVDDIPERLKNAVSRSGGKMLLLDTRESRMSRAQKLRDFAVAFERIVLHIHMYDTISFAAFGSVNFPRPVGFFNHADHVPWIGVSIADCVAEFREWGLKLSRECRGVTKSLKVGIPGDEEKRTSKIVGVEESRDDVRKRLGVPVDASLVLSCGRQTKYRSVAGQDFADVIRGILSADRVAFVVVIGPRLEDIPGWSDVAKSFSGRLKAVGPVPFELLSAYYKASDLVIDSYPLGGATALADALAAGCPVLSVPGPFGQDDWVYEINGLCQSLDEMVQKAMMLLKDKHLANEFVKHDQKVYREAHAPNLFRENLTRFFSCLNASHDVRQFSESVGLRPELERALFEAGQSEEILFRIPKILSFAHCRTSSSHTRVLTLLGHDIVIYRRWMPFVKALRAVCVSLSVDDMKEGGLT